MKKGVIVYALVIISLALAAFAVNPRDMKFSPLEFKPPEPIRFVTDNGMVVFFLEDHQLPVLAASALFHGGSAYDPPEKSGLAEITARLLRSGGAGDRNPDQVDIDLDFVGASISSSSLGDDLTVSMRTLKKDAELIFEIFFDIIMKPMFDSEKVALEISNKKDRIRRQNDDPYPITRRIFYETVYTGHAYGLYPTLSSMDNIRRADIIAQHKRYYAPDNCILAISGDMTLKEIKNVLDGYLGSWKKTGIKIENPPMATMQYKPGVYYAEKDINQAHIRFGHLCMDIKNPDRYAMDVMNFILGGGGFVSRLMNQVRTSAGLAYSVGSYVYNRPFMGNFFLYCQTKADAMSRAMQMMLDIVDDVRENGITQEEIELSKESLISNYVFNYDTPRKIVNGKAYLEFRGFPLDQLEKNIEAYQSVTLEDCSRVAEKYINPKNIAIIITGNKEMFDKPLDTFGPVTEVPMKIE